MIDETIKTTGVYVKLGTFVLLIILVAIAFGGAGYLYAINAGKTITSATVSKTTATAISATVMPATITSLSDDKFESEERCQSACKNYKFNQGGCYWQSEAESYADPSFSSNGVKKIGSCASGFNMGKHCQNGQCGCYCYNRPSV